MSSFLLLTSASLLLTSVTAISQAADWIVNPQSTPSTLDTTTPGYITLSNGLISRTFAVSPCFGTVEYMLVPGRTTFFRALSPEATVTLNGTSYQLGGCGGQPAGHSEFWQPDVMNLTRVPDAFQFANFSTSLPVAQFPWTPGRRHSPKTGSWPPLGLHLAGMEWGCASASTCLTGWVTCDNSSVPGQCTWPVATAVSECAQWPACAGVTCNSGRDDCQARDDPTQIFVNPSFTSFIRTSMSGYPLGNTMATMHYEIYDGLPVMRKWVTMSQGEGSPAPVVVDAMMIEILRAPNFAPDQMTVFQIEPNNPTPWSQQTVPVVSQAFPGRDEQYWFFDPDWDSCCDSELHVPYSYYTLLSVGYGTSTTFGGTTGPGALLVPGAPAWESKSIRFLLHDSTDWERQGLGVRKMQSVLAPQLRESQLYYMIDDISSTSAFQLAISQAAAVGMELVIVGYGAAGYCGMCPQQLQNATWVAWFKSNVDFARTLGVGVSAYTLMQHNGWGESVPAAEQAMNRDGSRAGVACFATDWHAAYRQSVLDFIGEVGLSGVETDGQYEDYACADAGGDHHHNGLEGSWDAQMAVTAQFNEQMKQQGIYQTGADAYLFSGANFWNHADTDAGYSLPSFWERLTVGRDYVYDSTTSRLHSSGGYGVSNPAAAAQQCASDPSFGRLACLDFALASFYAQGITMNPMGSYLWAPGDPDAAAIQATFQNWTTYFVAHRPTFLGHASVHLRRPTSRGYEATAFLLNAADAAAAGSSERALAVLYNPSLSPAADALELPLYYAGFAPGAAVVVSRVFPGQAPPVWLFNASVGMGGAAEAYSVLIPFALPPRSYAMFSVAAGTAVSS